MCKTFLIILLLKYNIAPDMLRHLLRKSADYSLKNNCIGSWLNSPCYMYVDLERNKLFKNLVDLYVPIIRMNLPKFSELMETYNIGVNIEDLPRWTAAVYISAWFHDLYISNRKSCSKISPVLVNEHYCLDLIHKSTEYDSFLSELSAQIRPTILHKTITDTPFVPRICQNMVENAFDGNNWNIDGWEMNEDALYGIIQIMKQLMRFKPLPDTTTGRPAWLFDWHDNGYAYAWFPMESNYTYDDVSVAYIVGGPCTPKLGTCDCDEMQQFPGNVVPEYIDKRNCVRVHDRRFFGSAEVRVIETHQVPVRIYGLGLPESVVSSEACRELMIEHFRIVDYVYYAQVILDIDLETRIAAHRMLTNPVL